MKKYKICYKSRWIKNKNELADYFNVIIPPTNDKGSLYFTQVYDLEQHNNVIGEFGSDLGFIDKK